MNSKTPIKRTAVYLDGYNLYYGRLRGTAFKWLDVVALFERLIQIQDQTSELQRITFFTAPALGKYATHGDASTQAQQDYHRALSNVHPGRFRLTQGSHSCDKSGTWLPTCTPEVPFDRNVKSRVWKLEEKQTDVNIAISMYRDASKGLFDQVVLCSNDSDQVPTLTAIKNDFPSVTIGVVIPMPPAPPGEQAHRASNTLQNLGDWTRRYILDGELEAAQLPNQVATNKRPVTKPKHW